MNKISSIFYNICVSVGNSIWKVSCNQSIKGNGIFTLIVRAFCTKDKIYKWMWSRPKTAKSEKVTIRAKNSD